MTLTELVNELKDFEILFEKSITREQAFIWFKYFKNWNYEQFKATKDNVIKDIYRFPTISDFFKNKAQITQPSQSYPEPSEEEREEVALLIKNTIHQLSKKGE